MIQALFEVSLSIELASELTFLHHLYIISFSIFYAVMLHTLKGLHAFDTSAAFTGNRKALSRFALSILILNLLPFLHFSVILLYLLHYLELNIFSILLVFGLSIGIFGFDKIFHAILIRGRKRLYTESELKSVVNFSDTMRRKFTSHYLRFLVPGLLYILVPFGLLLVAFNPIAGAAVISGSIIGSFVTWYRWKASPASSQDKGPP